MLELVSLYKDESCLTRIQASTSFIFSRCISFYIEKEYNNSCTFEPKFAELRFLKHNYIDELIHVGCISENGIFA